LPQHAKTHYAYINRAVPLSLWRVFINLVAITDLSEHKDPFKISPCPATPTSLPATATATARRRRPIPTALLSPRNPTARRRPLSHTPQRPTPSRPPPTINLRRTSPTPTAAEAAVATRHRRLLRTRARSPRWCRRRSRQGQTLTLLRASRWRTRTEAGSSTTRKCRERFLRITKASVSEPFIFSCITSPTPTSRR